MRLSLPALFFTLLLAPACEEQKPPGSPPEVPVAPDDASPGGRVVREADAAPTQLPVASSRLAELQGSWFGQANTQDFGLVSASLVVDEQGRVQANASGPGLSRNESFQILSWNGQTLELRFADATRMSLPAHRQGGELVLVLPQIGEVTLQRQAAKELPAPKKK